MKIYNRYILWLASLFLLTTVILAAFGQQQLDLYFSVYLIEGLALTELFVYLNPRARRGLNWVSYLLFAGFLGIVTAEVIRILGLKLPFGL